MVPRLIQLDKRWQSFIMILNKVSGQAGPTDLTPGPFPPREGEFGAEAESDIAQLSSSASSMAIKLAEH